jgi:hypothetical protein
MGHGSFLVVLDEAIVAWAEPNENPLELSGIYTKMNG